MNKDPNTLTGPKLSAWLGKVLQPDHTRTKCGGCRFIVLPDCATKPCEFANDKCGDFQSKWDIPLDDANVAMKWRDWAVAEYGKDDEGDTYFVKAMMGIYNFCGDKYGITAWLTDKAQPRHYLIAAAKCKENSNEESR